MTREEQFAKDLADYEAYKAQRQAEGKWNEFQFEVDETNKRIKMLQVYPDEKSAVYEIPAFIRPTCEEISYYDFSLDFCPNKNLKCVIYRGSIADWDIENNKIMVARGFVNAYNRGGAYTKEQIKEYNAYIKRNSEEYFGFNDDNREIFIYMLENKLITPKKLSMMLDRSDATTEERAALLEYQRKLNKGKSDINYLLD